MGSKETQPAHFPTGPVPVVQLTEWLRNSQSVTTFALHRPCVGGRHDCDSLPVARSTDARSVEADTLMTKAQ